MRDGDDIRQAEPRDLALLDAALRRLSEDIGDPHRADRAMLERALFGPRPSAVACIATAGEAAHGVTLFSPVFSTARGAAGLFVSDLWVAPEARGRGLGRALLRAAADEAADLWGAGFLRLIVHDHNEPARAFYDALGFESVTGETTLVLPGPALDSLRSSP
ncbi:GNAT family N-acetyltransferase [Jannaschia seohaensis]|uniref:Ribosomal protein S18 acetylase RimI n=1 Tax=Jannaschia seohaensis TaxID=475081 RepID=A0A2Y9AJI7_9RHOB|nr:N-acetyltransferase [Jannaschia seohaensis]PWJ20287.1 ribosomal protein S18 acetylase RimI-like enzyme [Jannaschia seohaensis]SSA44305.1 Ribosomal protein S18 acetylase RimI [Jannaschia seohaensis]